MSVSIENIATISHRLSGHCADCLSRFDIHRSAISISLFVSSIDILFFIASSNCHPSVCSNAACQYRNNKQTLGHQTHPNRGPNLKLSSLCSRGTIPCQRRRGFQKRGIHTPGRPCFIGREMTRVRVPLGDGRTGILREQPAKLRTIASAIGKIFSAWLGHVMRTPLQSRKISARQVLMRAAGTWRTMPHPSPSPQRRRS
jgi:hypothetical protein